MEVITAIIVAAITSGLTFLATFKRLRAQVERLYAERLLQPRIDRYPEAYRILSTFIKKIQQDEVTLQEIDSLKKDLEEWDSSNAIFLGDEASGQMYYVRSNVRKLLKATREGVPLSMASLQPVRLDLGKLEILLKRDLGIFLAEETVRGSLK